MRQLAEILEQELEEAVEVKNSKSLHRYIVLLTENMVEKHNYDQNISDVRSDIKILAESMKQGFEYMEKRFEGVDKRFEDMYKYMDKRFEAVDKRFEDMNKRFTQMFAFMNIGFGLIIMMTVLFKFFVQ